MDRGAWWATVHGVPKIWAPLSRWHVYKIDNQQRPLYSTGHSTQHSAITCNGKQPKKYIIHMCVKNSVCNWTTSLCAWDQHRVMS